MLAGSASTTLMSRSRIVFAPFAQVGDDSTSWGLSSASSSMFGPFGCERVKRLTLRTFEANRSLPPSVSPIPTGRTPRPPSVFAANGVSATIRFGGAD
jgi:hypothetical protein